MTKSRPKQRRLLRIDNVLLVLLIDLILSR